MADPTPPGQPVGVILQLVPIKTNNDAVGPTLVLHEGIHQLGRADDNDFVVAAPGVAQHHCRLEIQGGKVAVHRLDGNAVLSLNGKPVSGKPTSVLSGDRITLGTRVYRIQVVRKTTSGVTSIMHGKAGDATTKMPAVGSEFAGYRLEAILGAGGTAVVFRGVRPDNNTLAAVKVLRAGLNFSGGAAVRFYREAMVGGMLSAHPVAVAILEIGRSDPFTYIAMEYIDGVDCQKILDKHGKIPLKQTLDIILPVADLLRYAHASQLIHRDIKPGNIMVTNTGQVKLLDLGLAREEGRKDTYDLTQPSEGFGTLSFVAPEQAFDAAGVDFRADIYSLGATLFMMLTGRSAIQVDTPADFLKKLVKEGVPNLNTVDPTLPPALCAAVANCLKMDREQRFQRYEDLIRDFKAVRDTLG